MRALATLLMTAGLASPAAPALERFEYSQPHMGTLVRLVFYAADRTAAQTAADAAFARVAALDETLSDYRDTSEVMRVSRAAGGPPLEVSDDLYRVLRASHALARASGGAFDVTVGPLTILWRSARRHGQLPPADRVDEARARVGDALMEIGDGRRTVRLKTPGMQLDFGGIAKGFAADEAAAVLTRHGVGSALVAAGGDIVATAAPPDQDGWRVAISTLDPDPQFITLRDAAVSTSGDAEQFFEAGGRRYSHILDPRTGMPLVGRSSVTVVARDGMTADSLATALSVMEPGAALRLADSVDGAAARLARIDEGRIQIVYRSSRWRQR